MDEAEAQQWKEKALLNDEALTRRGVEIHDLRARLQEATDLAALWQDLGKTACRRRDEFRSRLERAELMVTKLEEELTDREVDLPTDSWLRAGLLEIKLRLTGDKRKED